MRWLSRRRRDADQPGSERGWFDLGKDVDANLSTPQLSFLEAARERLERLSPSKLMLSDSWAGFEPGYGSASGSPAEGALWLTLPIAGKRHKALQLGLWGDTIVGGWQDGHYAWDNPRGERFREQLQADDIEVVIGQALDWLEHELAEHQLI